MKIQDALLTINEWSRPGKELKETMAIIMHWTGNPKSSAVANRAFFESRKNGGIGYGSAHYIIGINGEILRCIPDNEVAYHCGTSQIDPVSKKIYTDWARKQFGKYATEKSSPNNCTIGIEMCCIDSIGNFTESTINSAIELASELCKKNQLSENDIGTHNMVVGWKDCPRLWTNRPALFDAFKKDVGIILRG